MVIAKSKFSYFDGMKALTILKATMQRYVQLRISENAVSWLTLGFRSRD